MRTFSIFVIMLATIMRTGRSFRFLSSTSRVSIPSTRALASRVPSSAFLSTVSTVYRPRLLRSQAMRMSSNPDRGGVDNPMNPNTYTEAAWDAIGKLPNYAKKVSYHSPSHHSFYYSNWFIYSLFQSHLLSFFFFLFFLYWIFSVLNSVCRSVTPSSCHFGRRSVRTRSTCTCTSRLGC